MADITLLNYSPNSNRLFGFIRNWLPDGEVYNRSALALPLTSTPLQIKVTGIVANVVTVYHKWKTNEGEGLDNYSVTIPPSGEALTNNIVLKNGYNMIYCEEVGKASKPIHIYAFYIHFFLYMYALEFLTLRIGTIQAMQNINLDKSFGDDYKPWFWSGISEYNIDIEALKSNYLDMLGIGEIVGYNNVETVTIIKNIMSAYRISGTKACFKLLGDAFGCNTIEHSSAWTNKTSLQPQLGIVSNVTGTLPTKTIYVSEKLWGVDEFKNKTLEIYAGTAAGYRYRINSNGTDSLVITIPTGGVVPAIGDSVHIMNDCMRFIKGSNYPIPVSGMSNSVCWGDMELFLERKLVKVKKGSRSLTLPSGAATWYYIDGEEDSDGFQVVKDLTQNPPVQPEPQEVIETITYAAGSVDILTDTTGGITGVKDYKYIEAIEELISLNNIVDQLDVDATKEFDVTNAYIIPNTNYICLGSNRDVINSLVISYQRWKKVLILARVFRSSISVMGIDCNSYISSGGNIGASFIQLSTGAQKYLTELYYDDSDLGSDPKDYGFAASFPTPNKIQVSAKSWTVNQWVGGEVRFYNVTNSEMLNWSATIISNTSDTLEISLSLPATVTILDQVSIISPKRKYVRDAIAYLVGVMNPIYKQTYLMFKGEPDENALGSYYRNYFFKAKFN